jgi:hypothetical protein
MIDKRRGPVVGDEFGGDGFGGLAPAVRWVAPRRAWARLDCRDRSIRLDSRRLPGRIAPTRDPWTTCTKGPAVRSPQMSSRRATPAQYRPPYCPETGYADRLQTASPFCRPDRATED